MLASRHRGRLRVARGRRHAADAVRRLSPITFFPACSFPMHRTAPSSDSQRQRIRPFFCLRQRLAERERIRWRCCSCRLEQPQLSRSQPADRQQRMNDEKAHELCGHQFPLALLVAPPALSDWRRVGGGIATARWSAPRFDPDWGRHPHAWSWEMRVVGLKGHSA